MSTLVLVIVTMVCGMRDTGADELLAGWELYLARNDLVNGQVLYKVLTNSSPTPDRDDLFVYGYRDGCAFGECHYRGSTKRSEAYGYNSAYAFTLDQDLVSNQWRLIGTHKADASTHEHARAAKELHVLKGYMFQLASSNEYLVAELRARKFKIDSVKPKEDGQWLLVQFHATDSDAKQRFTKQGTLKCYNQAPYYLPKECSLKSAWPDSSLPGDGRREGVHEHSFDYDTSEAIPRLTAARRLRSVPGLAKHSKVEQTMHFELTNRPPPPERFFLSHYGLFEPHGVAAPQPQPWFLYGSLSGIAIVVVGVLMIRWSRRAA